MGRVVFIQHQGKRVLLLDYTNLHDEKAMLEMIEDRKDAVSKEPPGSVLTLADLTGVNVSKHALQAIKEANALERPFVRKAALVGADTMTPKGGVEAVGTFAHKDWGRFTTRQEALDWLVAES